jgi:7-carboxy-7-deazaguanine synthase
MRNPQHDGQLPTLTAPDPLGLPLVVSEVFHSVQGEGPATGRPATFLRLGGCNLTCAWCFAPDTGVLMADWTEKAISEVRVGDYVWSYRKRQYEIARVEQTMTRDAAERVSVRYGDRETICTPDHIFATPHHIDARLRSRADELMGRHVRVTKLDGWLPDDAVRTEDWWTGWLQGLILGDGHVGMSAASPYMKVWLRVCDRELAEAFCAEINRRGARCTVREARRKTTTGRQVYSVAVSLSRAPEMVGLPEGEEQITGFLAGFFDAEGSTGRGQLSLSQADNKTLDRVAGMCRSLGIPVTVSPYQGGRAAGAVTVNGLANVDRFFRLTRPVLTRKSHAHRHPERQLASTAVEQVKTLGAGPVVNLTTSTGYFFANGALVEQCDAGYTWDAAHYDLRAELVRRTAGDVLAELTEHGTPGLVIVTGGEPLLQQRPGYGLGPLLGELVARGSAVHVETNGTIPPTPELAGLVGLFVVSPKLGHAGMPTDRTLHPQVLTGYATLAEAGRACLKVVCATPADVTATAGLADECGWPRQAVWIMPEGVDVATLTARHEALIGPTLAHGLNTSTRLHILAYGDTRGT